MQLSPVQSLVLVLLVGIGISGWLYGLHWKKVASGDGLTKDEKVIFRLQGQIDVLTEQNARLNAALEGNSPGQSGGEGSDSASGAAPASNVPLLQEQMQEVELPRK